MPAGVGDGSNTRNGAVEENSQQGSAADVNGQPSDGAFVALHPIRRPVLPRPRTSVLAPLPFLRDRHLRSPGGGRSAGETREDAIETAGTELRVRRNEAAEKRSRFHGIEIPIPILIQPISMDKSLGVTGARGGYALP